MSERAREITSVGEELQLGVIQLHPQNGLRNAFYEVVDDLRSAGAIVDLWLMDIAQVLEDHGYELNIRRID